MAKIIRVHSDVDTVDVPVQGKSPKAPQTEAYFILREGFWSQDGTKLYPPNRITYLEIRDV